MFGNNLADIFEGAALCGAYYVHHLFVTGPLLGFAEHFFEEAFAVGVFRQLEVVRAFVAGQRKQDYPFAFVRKERGSHCLRPCRELRLRNLYPALRRRYGHTWAEVFPMSPRLASAMMNWSG